MKRLRLFPFALFTFVLTACDIAVLDPITRPNREAPKGDDKPSAPSNTPPDIDEDDDPQPDAEPGPLTSNPACLDRVWYPNEIIFACGLNPDTHIVAVSARHIATVVPTFGKTLDRIDRVTKQTDTIARADSEVPTMTWGEFTFSPELGRVAYSAAFANDGGVSVGIRTVELDSGNIRTLSTSGYPRNLTHVGTDLFFNATESGAIRRVSFNGGDVVTVGDGEIAVGSTGGWTYYLHWVDDAYALARVRVGGGVPQEIARDVTRWYRRPVALDSKGGAYYVQRGTLEEPWRLLYVGPDHPFSIEILVCSDVDHCGDRPTWVKLYGNYVFVGGELGSNIAYGKTMERNVPSFIQVSRFRGQSSIWFEGGYVFETYARGGYDIPLEGIVSARPLPPLDP